MRRLPTYCLALVVILGLSVNPWPPVAVAREYPTPSGVIRIDPPEQGFYAKKLNFRGIPIKAHAVVADKALFEARRRLRMLLEKTPNVLANLVTEGAELHIIGKDQVTSDLPENRELKGKPFDGNQNVDERTRGLGGLVASCGEENLLRLPDDRYEGRDICAHEFAHTILAYGFSDDTRKRVAAQYKESTGQGRWKSAYAASNDDEFFAELTMWYFGTHGDYGRIRPAPKPGREWFERYDPEAFRLIDDLYNGHIKVDRLRLVALAPLPPDQEPTLKSLSGDTPTTLRLVNKTPREVQLYWINYDGKREKYGTIPPGGRDSRTTFATHAWLLADADDKGLAIFVAQPKAGIGVLQEKEDR